MAKEVYNILYKPGQIFLMDDILEVLKQNPRISLINQGVNRSDMYK
jgi:spore coat polysaccharide biosynthesis protein SpsF (cytidylyltransferase family)